GCYGTVWVCRVARRIASACSVFKAATSLATGRIGRAPCPRPSPTAPLTHIKPLEGVRAGPGGDGRRAVAPRAAEIPRLDLAFPLDRDPPARHALELVPDELVGRVGDLDPPGRPVRFHAARGVHRVTPEVVEEPLAPDHAGHDRAGVDPDAEREPPLRRCGARAA